MTDFNQTFFEAYLRVFPNKIVYTDNFPIEMKGSEKDEEGWIEWKPIRGTLEESSYHQIEKNLGALFPQSFINWHKSFFFLDGDCSILRLPYSNPSQPLEEIKRHLNWFIPEQLIPQKIYPFGDEGNDIGLLIFDGRKSAADNEFPIRFYDNEYGGDLNGLSEIIFSSFTKLLECVAHYLTELQTRRNFEIIPDFFKIDANGAGSTGIDYWLSWSSMQKANFEEFGD